MNYNFFDGHDELYHHAKIGGDRTTRVGCRCENVVFVFFTSRMPRSGKLPVLNLLTHRPKIRFFAPQGRLVAPIQVKVSRIDGHLGPLGCAKFCLNRQRGVGMRPQKYPKIPLFDKESPRTGDSLDRFRNFFGCFIRLTILH